MDLSLDASTTQAQGSEEASAVSLDDALAPQLEMFSETRLMTDGADPGPPKFSEDATLDTPSFSDAFQPWADQDLTLLGYRMDSILGFPNYFPAPSGT